MLKKSLGIILLATVFFLLPFTLFIYYLKGAALYTSSFYKSDYDDCK